MCATRAVNGWRVSDLFLNFGPGRGSVATTHNGRVHTAGERGTARAVYSSCVNGKASGGVGFQRSTNWRPDGDASSNT